MTGVYHPLFGEAGARRILSACILACKKRGFVEDGEATKSGKVHSSQRMAGATLYRSIGADRRERRMNFLQWMGIIIDRTARTLRADTFRLQRKSAAIMVGFILSFATLPCAAAWGQDVWKKIENRYFSFSVPSSFRKTEASGIDSFAEEYVTDRIKLMFDYGNYSNNFGGWPDDTKFEYLKINYKGARIGVAMHEFHKGFPYSTAVYIKLDGRTSLNMSAACKSEEEVALVKKIFNTISFNEQK